MQVHAQFVTVNGVKTRVLCAGDGPPLALLHPIGHSADLFIRNLDVLGRKFSVFAPDLPGHGFSDTIEFSGRPPQIATGEHVFALMTELGHEHFDLAGSSFGGLVAALMAIRKPQRIKRLCVIGSASTFTTGDTQEEALRAVIANASTAMQSPSLESCRQRLGNICFDRATVPEEVLPLQVTYYALPDRFAAFRSTIEGLIASGKIGEGAASHRLGEISLPVQVIVGREDIRADWRAHSAGVEQMPNGRIEIFDQCGHLPYLEHPERFNETLLAFFGE